MPTMSARMIEKSTLSAASVMKAPFVLLIVALQLWYQPQKWGNSKMPLTKKGMKIRKAMEKYYGKEKGKAVFYASENKGSLGKGVVKESRRGTPQTEKKDY